MDNQSRILSLDYIRGLVIVLMLLDHASLIIGHTHYSEYWGVPLPQYSDTLAFMSRVITHLCAPAFCVLMGIGIVFFVQKRISSLSVPSIRKMLIIRGLILISIEHLIVNVGWLFGSLFVADFQSLPSPGDGKQTFLLFSVLFALGTSMIAWGFLMHLRSIYIILISVSAIIITQVLVPESSQVFSDTSLILRYLAIPGNTSHVAVLYPFLPWFGLVGIGIVIGRCLTLDCKKTFLGLFIIGIVLLMLFIVIRIFDGVGNLHAVEFTFQGIFTVTKYPPSLAYITLTLGFLFILMFIAQRFTHSLPFLNIIKTFGQTALFFYATHLYALGLVAMIITTIGVTLSMYIGWLLALALLYPLCRYYLARKNQLALESTKRLF